jgi:hypothetical protein
MISTWNLEMEKGCMVIDQTAFAVAVTRAM